MLLIGERWNRSHTLLQAVFVCDGLLPAATGLTEHSSWLLANYRWELDPKLKPRLTVGIRICYSGVTQICSRTARLVSRIQPACKLSSP